MVEGCALHKIMYNDSGKPYDYVIIDINPAYETILSLKKDQVIGRSLRYMVPFNLLTWIFTTV